MTCIVENTRELVAKHIISAYYMKSAMLTVYLRQSEALWFVQILPVMTIFGTAL
jgi:hypothetical protein